MICNATKLKDHSKGRYFHLREYTFWTTTRFFLMKSLWSRNVTNVF